MKTYPFNSKSYGVSQLADELVAAGVPMGGAAYIERNAYPLATNIVIHANDAAVDATVNAVVAAHEVVSNVPMGTSAGTACQGNDPRLSDARNPVTHSHSQSEVTGLVAALAGKETAGAAAAAQAASLPVAGTAAKATILATARNINGVSFDGSAPITVSAAPNGSAGGDLVGTFPNPTVKASVALTTPNIGAATGTSLAVTGAITSSGGGVGYATGSGGTVSQLTSKVTGVTLNKLCGTITTHNAALASGAIVTFTVTNNQHAAGDVVHIQHDSGGTVGPYIITPNTSAAGSFKITLRNTSAGSLGEALVLRFVILKGAVS